MERVRHPRISLTPEESRARQRESLLRAIEKKKAQISYIKDALAKPAPMVSRWGGAVHVSQGSVLRLHEELAHEEVVLADLKTQLQGGGVGNASVPSTDSASLDDKGRFGALVTKYDEELRKLKQLCRPVGKSRSTLQQEHPELSIWDAINNSPLVRPDKVLAFFDCIYASGQADRFELIGSIFGVSGDTAYKWYKEHRKSSGTKRRRQPRVPPRPKKSPKIAPKP